MRRKPFIAARSVSRIISHEEVRNMIKEGNMEAAKNDGYQVCGKRERK